MTNPISSYNSWELEICPLDKRQRFQIVRFTASGLQSAIRKAKPYVKSFKKTSHAFLRQREIGEGACLDENGKVKCTWAVDLASNTATTNVSSYMSLIGQKGGKSGTGKSKKRGDVSYYKKISKKAAMKRSKKK